MINQLIERYKRFRTEQYLAQIYQYQYAFVGMGQHSLSNLYPVIRYLQIPPGFAIVPACLQRLPIRICNFTSL